MNADQPFVTHAEFDRFVIDVREEFRRFAQEVRSAIEPLATPHDLRGEDRGRMAFLAACADVRSAGLIAVPPEAAILLMPHCPARGTEVFDQGLAILTVRRDEALRAIQSH